MRERVVEAVLSDKLIAIVRGLSEDKVIPLAHALYDGGIHMMEVTFNQSAPSSFSETTKAIRALRKEFNGRVLVGAGTVCTQEQLEQAADAGALYIITPNTNPKLITEVRKKGLVSMPGALTPSECVIAHEAGADFVKLFPLGNFGPDYLKAVRAPLSHIRFLGVGGINEKNIKDYLDAGAVGFGVGGNLVHKDWIAAGEFDKITALAKQYVAAVN